MSEQSTTVPVVPPEATTTAQPSSSGSQVGDWGTWGRLIISEIEAQKKDHVETLATLAEIKAELALRKVEHAILVAQVDAHEKKKDGVSLWQVLAVALALLGTLSAGFYWALTGVKSDLVAHTTVDNALGFSNAARITVLETRLVYDKENNTLLKSNAVILKDTNKVVNARVNEVTRTP
jgi:hypothetical protein